ncbi:hypothetical protein RFM26_22075 [Mesorhizobium sp. VK23B]|uniref:Uncharacterized protein n=1 Tax=Mesorhizobium dulcispinae TaxID=3072316 RepID=A0ABU4XIY4_9HYPH|nr:MULTISPECIES: hypothetical protein [unclassified Mesorhizobium]MDX8468392.1 hypothetical protein [Mesorhizobium sp. VK23B]MDX8474730.1 hypothetical protein [Mesorhizobium sp. VK23A]MDX8519758.1 hypothetical protein [Mesorhizobium sp. VK23D]
MTRFSRGLIGQGYAICGFFANFAPGVVKKYLWAGRIDFQNPSFYKPAHARAIRPGAVSIAPKTGPAKLLLQSDRIKKGRTPRY